MGNKEKKAELRSMIRQILRKSWWWILLLLVLCIVPFVILDVPESFSGRLMQMGSSLYKLLCLTIFMFLAISVCRSLTDYFSLKKNETGITWCQISILLSILIWILAFLLIFDIHKESSNFLALGIVGTMLGWVFQDTIKGVAAFLHLRLNHLLCIDDWIQVPKYKVDGEVKHITLTTVTVSNWDTTTSSFPISVLHSDHFINLERMAQGKTYGRRSLKTIILDTGWLYPITAQDANRLKQQKELKSFLPEEEIHEGVLNAQLYRLYLYHWLMSHPKVSQHPFLVVRWLEQKEAGLPLQIIIYITEGGFAEFEWWNAKITEHIVESLSWFGLRLYQRPSSYDVTNPNVHLTDEKAVYRKEIGQ